MEILLTTTKKQEFIDLSDKIEARVVNGLCFVYCPHTTAGLTINEGADPDVKSDVLRALDKITPELKFDHIEGNSPAHIKSILTGNSLNILIKNGKLLLGRWQSIFFCEYDGPRNRTIHINFLTK